MFVPLEIPVAESRTMYAEVGRNTLDPQNAPSLDVVKKDPGVVSKTARLSWVYGYRRRRFTKDLRARLELRG